MRRPGPQPRSILLIGVFFVSRIAETQDGRDSSTKRNLGIGGHLLHRYFKLVCLHNDPNLYIQEFHNGRARFGWSGPGSDLRKIRVKVRDGTEMSDEERITWRYTQFLSERIVPGNRLVIQTEQPLRRFLIGEVVTPGYDFTPGNLPDYNHVLSVKPLTRDPIPINSKAVTAALKHDLSKRGQYYEIYPEDSIAELDAMVERLASETIDLSSIRTDDDTLDDTLQSIKGRIVREISRKWPAKDFERFCEILCNQVDYIEIKKRQDIGKGWDLLLRVINPLTRTTLMDDVPVQCKNYSGEVDLQQPIDDLERCVRNSNSPIAYLFILGKLSPEFRHALERRQESLGKELGREVSFEVVDQDRIAELYATFLDNDPKHPMSDYLNY
jgi:hypothetical protein